MATEKKAPATGTAKKGAPKKVPRTKTETTKADVGVIAAIKAHLGS